METTATEETGHRRLVVRDVQLEDAGVVAELSCQLGYQTTEADVARRLAAMLPLAQDHAVLVATLDGEVVGWGESEICRHVQAEPYALLTGLVVKDGVRSLGVGRRLCLALEDWARGRGIAVMRVTSRSTRERAHAFYLRGGYSEIKTSKVFEKAL
jgi:GNAT superfamily N-acetyltransferase